MNLVRGDVSKVFDTGPEIQDYIRIDYRLVHLLCQAQVGPGHVGTWEEEMLMSFHFQSWQFLEKWWKMGKRVLPSFHKIVEYQREIYVKWETLKGLSSWYTLIYYVSWFNIRVQSLCFNPQSWKRYFFHVTNHTVNVHLAQGMD